MRRTADDGVDGTTGRERAGAEDVSDRGSAIVEFVLVTALLALLLFGVIQVAAVF